MNDLEREACLRVRDARRNVDESKDEYTSSILSASALGLSPTVIAHQAGVTEAAIRQTLKRNR